MCVLYIHIKIEIKIIYMKYHLNMKTFKVILVGDYAVGKTTYLQKCNTGNIDTKYISSLGADIKNITFNLSSTNIKYEDKCKVILDVWDCSDTNFCNSPDTSYYEGADAAIIMFDLERYQTHTTIDKYVQNIKFISKINNDKIVIVGNKCESKSIFDDKIVQKYCKLNNLEYIRMSLLETIEFSTPFLTLIRQLMKNNDLEIVDGRSYEEKIMESWIFTGVMNE